MEATEFGILQVADRWATFSGRARVSPSDPELPFRAIVDQVDPFHAGAGADTVRITPTIPRPSGSVGRRGPT